METPAKSFGDLFDSAESYVKTTYELSKLRALEGVTLVVTALVSKLVVIIVGSLFIFALSIGVALWLGESLGKLHYGFFIVAGFYLLVGIILNFFLHKWLKRPVTEVIITETLQ